MRERRWTEKGMNEMENKDAREMINHTKYGDIIMHIFTFWAIYVMYLYS